MKKKKKLMIIIFSSIILLTTTITIILLNQGLKGYLIVTTRTGDISSFIVANGTINTLNEENVLAAKAGQINLIKNTYDLVEKDEVVMQIIVSDTETINVLSPIDGEIVVKVLQNQKISSGASLFTVTDYTRFVVNATVSENDIFKITLNDSCKVTINALPKTSFDGSVNIINKKGTFANGITTYTVQAILTVSEDVIDNVFIGMSAEVRIEIERSENAVLIDIIAIQYEGRQAFVYLKTSDNKLRRVNITTGLSTGTVVEVVSGLTSNVNVYYKPSSGSGSLLGGIMN